VNNSHWRPFVILPILLSAGACHYTGPPRLLRYEIWQGRPADPTSVQIVPAKDGSLTLRFDTSYTALAYLTTSARVDRCVYRVFDANWAPPSRDFYCSPETTETAVLTEDLFASRGDIARTPAPTLTISVAEYDVGTRQELNRYTPYVFPVHFLGM
jgi:hypothetical protein